MVDKNVNIWKLNIKRQTMLVLIKHTFHGERKKS